MAETTAESIWTEVRGWRMHARAAGVAAPDATPIILVHGLGMSHRYMMPTLHALVVRRARVYAVDLPGFGKSDQPAEAFDVPQLADALAGWIDANDLRGSILVGNSFGCQIIVDAVARDGRLAAAVVLVAPTMDRAARTVRKQLTRLIFDAPFERLSLVPLAFYEYFIVVGFSRALQTLRYALADRIEDKLARVHVPALVVRGGRDPLVPPEWTNEVVRDLPDARLVVLPKAAHAVNYDAPDELAQVIIDFGEPHSGITHGSINRDTRASLDREENFT